MTTSNFQCTSLLLSKIVRVQNKQDNQGYQGNERKHAMIATNIRPEKYWFRRMLAKTTNSFYAFKLQDYVEKYWFRRMLAKTTNSFYASKLQDYVEEGLLFQNKSKPKTHPCWPKSPVFSHSTILGYATFCWFCDAGSQMVVWMLCIIFHSLLFFSLLLLQCSSNLQPSLWS